mmetsp:Transcript_120117/g.339927  ORF Transcript_120117/g.339927 Transcript_120117/m.339927 type:complete len:210 (-) Transcript_120117:148-777(-)
MTVPSLRARRRASRTTRGLSVPPRWQKGAIMEGAEGSQSSSSFAAMWASTWTLLTGPPWRVTVTPSTSRMASAPTWWNWRLATRTSRRRAATRATRRVAHQRRAWRCGPTAPTNGVPQWRPLRELQPHARTGLVCRPRHRLPLLHATLLPQRGSRCRHVQRRRRRCHDAWPLLQWQSRRLLAWGAPRCSRRSGCCLDAGPCPVYPGQLL